MSTDDGKALAAQWRDRVEELDEQRRELAQALRDVLPYAEAAIGPAWRANPPADSVLSFAKLALSRAERIR